MIIAPAWFVLWSLAMVGIGVGLGRRERAVGRLELPKERR